MKEMSRGWEEYWREYAPYFLPITIGVIAYILFLGFCPKNAVTVSVVPPIVFILPAAYIIHALRERVLIAETSAGTDVLTGLFNRRGAMEAFRISMRLLARERRKNGEHATEFAVVMFDADGFKKLNDRDGHAAGDRLLQEIASLMMVMFPRDSDIRLRLGGDEFAVILPDTGIDMAFSLAEAFRKKAEAAFQRDGVTLSIGVSAKTVSPEMSYNSQGLLADLEETIREADGGLYRSKMQGKNQVTRTPPQIIGCFK